MQCVLVGYRIMISDSCCNRKGSQCIRSEVCCILALILTGIYLVSGRYDKAYIPMILDGIIQDVVPIVTIISCCKVVCCRRRDLVTCGYHFLLLGTGLILGSSDLRIADIQEGETVKRLCCIALNILPLAVLEYLIIIFGILFQILNNCFVGEVFYSIDCDCIRLCSGKFLCTIHVLLGSDTNGWCLCGMAVPCEIQLCLIGSRSQ